MNFDLNDIELTERIRRAFQHPLPNNSEEDYAYLHGNSAATVYNNSDAFPVVFIRRPFDEEFLRSVRQQLLRQHFHQKHNDLYKFLQSEDLTRISEADCGKAGNPLKQLHDAICSKAFVSWIQKVTGVQLVSGRIDMAGQRYRKHDRLLCHDDEIEEGDLVRRIAFIIYLVDEQWCFGDGGRLELFSAHKNDSSMVEPGEVVTRLVPQFNSMAFFEVTPSSFHQVSEVLTDRAERISLTGWFYGPPSTLPVVSSPTRSHPIEEISFSGVESIDQHYLADLSEHINPIYAARQAKRAIQRQFAKDSAIELRQFLSSAGLSAFIKGISENYQSAQFRGPPNRRSYCTISASSIHRFFGSVEFREYLEQITGLKLREPLLNSVRSSPIEIRMFTPGSFTMINDNFLEPEGLDVTFYLISGEPGNDDDEMACGGNTVYIDGEDTLLVVEPAVNMLSIVYRRGQTQRFVEYLSTNYPGERLVDVSATFTVNNQ